MPDDENIDESPDLATINIKAGQITLRKTDEDGFELCNKDACLALPSTGSEAMGLLEFFLSMEDKKDE